MLRPQKGPQWDFFCTPADIAIYGGAAGGGKSWALTLEPLRHIKKPGFNAIVFRRTSPELTGGGSIWSEMQGIYPSFGGVPRTAPVLDWTFKNEIGIDALVELRHLQYEKDLNAHQSKQYALIIFDELTHFEERMFWYMVSRNRSVCGVRPYIRAATNPDPDSFVAKLIEWWIDPDTGYPIQERSGKVRWFIRHNEVLHWDDSAAKLKERFPEYFAMDPLNQAKSFTFIAAKLEDNPALLAKDPGYAANLASMPKVDRERLRLGNWKVRASAGDYFPRLKVEFVDAPPEQVIERVRGWDKAATKPNPQNKDPDWTIGVKMSKGKDGYIYVEHVHRMRDNPLEVENAIKTLADQDGLATRVLMWQDPGQAGKSEIAHFKRLLFGRSLMEYPATKDKTTYARPFSSQWLAGNVRIVRGPWNEPYLNVMENFAGPETSGHDDDVDASSLCFLALGNMSALEFLKTMTGR